jgi:hypothetical protein
MKFLISVFLMIVGSAAQALDVSDCDWKANAQGLVEPWQDNTRLFANGTVRLALVDTIEPAAGAFYILVFSPPENELGERLCQAVGITSSVGFSDVGFQKLKTNFDPAIGLIFDVSVNVFDAETGKFPEKALNFTLNMATGKIMARYK